MYSRCIQNKTTLMTIMELSFIWCGGIHIDFASKICCTRPQRSSQMACYISKHWSASTVHLCIWTVGKYNFFLVTGMCTCQGSVKAFKKLRIHNFRLSETMEIYYEYYMRLSRMAIHLAMSMPTNQQHTCIQILKLYFSIFYLIEVNWWEQTYRIKWSLQFVLF